MHVSTHLYLPAVFVEYKYQPKKPPNTASTAVGYCSQIPQQINMYSVQLHFILSVYRIIVFFLLNTCPEMFIKAF